MAVKVPEGLMMSSGEYSLFVEEINRHGFKLDPSDFDERVLTEELPSLSGAFYDFTYYATTEEKLKEVKQGRLPNVFFRGKAIEKEDASAFLPEIQKLSDQSLFRFIELYDRLNERRGR